MLFNREHTLPKLGTRAFAPFFGDTLARALVICRWARDESRRGESPCLPGLKALNQRSSCVVHRRLDQCCTAYTTVVKHVDRMT
jgi:hypothetical protein